jgi:hypothetical protein
MSAPVSHFVYAQFYLDRHPERDAAAFLAGSVFPDIHYLGTVDRKATHDAKKATAESMRSESDSWVAGTQHHNRVDDAWRVYVQKNAPEYLEDELTVKALKMLEDETTYPMIPDWLPVRVALRVVPNQEQKLVTSDVSLKWHRLLIKLVVAPPSRERRDNFLRELKYEDEAMDLLDRRVRALRVDPKVQKLIAGLTAFMLAKAFDTYDV